MKRTMTALFAVTILVLAGCTAEPPTENSNQLESQEEDSTLHVFAAASLQKSFDEIAEEFTNEQPHVSVDFNYAGSSTLVQNLQDGAPADVFASADEANMDQAEQGDLIDAQTRELFAANRLVGIVPAGNPAQVSSLAEANAEGVNLVICAPQVPCGALSQTLAETAGLTLEAVSEEQQVSDVLGKVRSGQADAGLVYATDAALAPDDVEVFDVEGADDQLNYYPIARTSNAEDPEAAEAFIAFVHSETGQQILEDNGFTAP